MTADHLLTKQVKNLPVDAPPLPFTLLTAAAPLFFNEDSTTGVFLIFSLRDNNLW